MAWPNLEEFTGEVLFPVARQPRIGGGGRPDIVALDESAQVVVVEIKRDVDRDQLAQCLEYAGRARRASLDELAKIYTKGASAFFADWQEFTESSAPVVINPHPRRVLIARDLHDPTQSAVDYLVESGVPVRVIRVALYEDQTGRRFVDVGGEHEPELVPSADTPEVDHTKIAGRRVRLQDLLEYASRSPSRRPSTPASPTPTTAPSSPPKPPPSSNTSSPPTKVPASPSTRRRERRGPLRAGVDREAWRVTYPSGQPMDGWISPCVDRTGLWTG